MSLVDKLPQDNSRGGALATLQQRAPVLKAFFAIAAIIAVPLFLGPFGMRVANMGMIMGLSAMALTVLIGYAGLLSLGHAAFMAIGAFTAGILAAEHGVGFIPSLLLGGLVGMAVGALVALVTVRAFGLYLAIGTFALQYVVELVLTDIEVSMTYAVGFMMPTPSVFGHALDNDTSWWFFNVACAAAVYGVLVWMLRGHVARAWITSRDNPTVAATLGISILRSRVGVFAVTSFIAGFAGALQGYYGSIVQVTNFPLHLSIVYVTVVVLGGLGNLFGAVIAANFILVLPHVLEKALIAMGVNAMSGGAAVESMALGAILILVLLKAPQTVMSMLKGTKHD